MQNLKYLQRCIDELRLVFDNVSLVEGDQYYPILAIKLGNVVLPEAVIEDVTDIIIPLARCSGYLPGASLAGLHVDRPLHGMFEGEKTLIPFCDPVEDTEWMQNTLRFYPYYEHEQTSLIGTSYLCLNEPQGQPENPYELLMTMLDYLENWIGYTFTLADQHGSVIRGEVEGDQKESLGWVEHLVEHVSPMTKQALLESAGVTLTLSN
jgi:hypothetical protein